MKRFALAAALLLVLVFPTSASAAVNQYNAGTATCTEAWHDQGDPVPFICLAEDTSYGGDKLTISLSSDISDLRNVGHTGTGVCDTGVLIFTGDSWNDCISSFWGKLGKDDSFCLYRSANFNDLEAKLDGPNTSGTVWTVGVTNLHTTYGANDVASAVALQQSDPSCN